MHLYETHLAVADTEAAQAFYTGVVGLQFAHRDLTRDIVFLWAGDQRRSMLGLWGPTTSYGRDVRKSHLAFAVSLAELLGAGETLRRSGVTCQDFRGEQTNEPSVIGWMPSAQLYFRDQMGILSSSSLCWTTHQSRALMDHSPSGATDLTRRCSERLAVPIPSVW